MDWQFTPGGLYFTTMNDQNIKRIHRITALIFVAAIIFFLFFQVNKRSPLVEANPFADDPYDAVGSIAIQVALLISLLTYARVLRWRDDPPRDKGTAGPAWEHPGPGSHLHHLVCRCDSRNRTTHAPFFMGKHPEHRIGLMFVLTFICGLALWLVFRGTPTAAPPI